MKQDKVDVNPATYGAEDGCVVVDWHEEARSLLKSVLVRNAVSTSDLIARLSKIGVDESRKGLEAKLRRGTFSAAFFLQCMNALEIDELSDVRAPKLKVKGGRTVKSMPLHESDSLM